MRRPDAKGTLIVQVVDLFVGTSINCGDPPITQNRFSMDTENDLESLLALEEEQREENEPPCWIA